MECISEYINSSLTWNYPSQIFCSYRTFLSCELCTHQYFPLPKLYSFFLSEISHAIYFNLSPVNQVTAENFYKISNHNFIKKNTFIIGCHSNPELSIQKNQIYIWNYRQLDRETRGYPLFFLHITSEPLAIKQR
jgi:hypothetical protein